MVIGVVIDGVAMVSDDGEWMTLKQYARKVEGHKPSAYPFKGSVQITCLEN